MLLEIIPEEDAQLNLFSLYGDTAKKKALMQAVDSINARWGRSSVRSASEGSGKPWQMRRSYLSNRYTTEWREIPQV